MTEPFDPYYRWLGISTKERPPNHYRLLGLELFESDLQVIDSIASRHIDYLQEINDGPHVKQSQQLLNELATARRCLLDPASKEAYDSELRTKLRARRKPPKAVPPPKPPPPAETIVVPPPPVEPQPKVPQQSGPLPGAPYDREPPVAVPARSASSRRSSTRNPQRRPSLTALVIGGSVCALALITIGIWLSTGSNRNDEMAAATSGGAAKPVTSESPEPSSESKVDPQQRVGEQQTELSIERPAGEQTNAPGEPGIAVGEDTAQPLDAAPGWSDAELTEGSKWDESIPTDGLQLWLDASRISTLKLTGDQRIRSWTDKSSAGRQATAERAELRPELVPGVLGDRPAVRFHGTEWLEIAGTSSLIQNPTDYSLVFVARGALGTLLSKGTGETDSSFSMSRGVASFRAGDRDLGAATADVADFCVRSVVADAASLRWYVDGAPSGRHEAAHEIGKTNIVRVGCTYRNGQGAEALLQGDLAELLVYDRTLTDEERSAVEACLREKWLSGDAAPFPFDLPEPSIASDVGRAADAAGVVHGRSDESMEVPDSGGPNEPADSKPHEGRFVVLEPVAMAASAGSGLQLREDGAVLSDNTGSGEETFRITLETAIPKITAILLEALPDDSLPGKGPGHGLAGTFSLTEFSITAGPKNESQPPQSVSLTSAICEDASGAERLIDGDAKTSWTVRRRSEITRVVFLPPAPMGDEAGTRLCVTLACREALGCFRILVTSASNPRILPLDDRPNAAGGENSLVLQVNLSGKAWQEPGGGRWVESREFDGATFGHEGGRRIKTDAIEHPVFGTAQQGIMAFRAVVPNGTYEVQLYFSEHWTTEVGRRLFSVFIERQPALQPVNMFRAPGLGGPYIHKITNVNVADGRLDIDFTKAGEDTSTILNGVTIRRTR